jgi:indole-3-glycerol phosphate synthase
MSSFLDKIRPSIEERVKRLPEIQMEGRPEQSFCTIFEGTSVAIIAEVKLASPSRGRIYQGPLNPVEIAGEYLTHGANALSILTEPHYFQGELRYLEEVHEVFPQAPLLMKDFIISPKQIAQGFSSGASAILLIAAFLEPKQLEDLYAYTLSLELTPIIEVHARSELEHVLSLSPQVIGINNRNLNTLDISLETSKELIQYIPEGCYAISESGIESQQDMQMLSALGFDGFLIGSSLMKHSNPGNALARLLS